MFSIINIVIPATFCLLLVASVFPVEESLSKILKLKIAKEQALLFLLLVILLTLLRIVPFGFLISFLPILLSFLIFIFGFLSNRKYIYSLALVSLFLTPCMLILKIDKLADFFAQTCYLLLVLGVLKDILYEKIYK